MHVGYIFSTVLIVEFLLMLNTNIALSTEDSIIICKNNAAMKCFKLSACVQTENILEYIGAKLTAHNL